MSGPCCEQFCYNFVVLLISNYLCNIYPNLAQDKAFTSFYEGLLSVSDENIKVSTDKLFKRIK